jgi:hypothetical protein
LPDGIRRAGLGILRQMLLAEGAFEEFQSAAVKPSAVKKRALNRPIGCSVDSK